MTYIARAKWRRSSFWAGALCAAILAVPAGAQQTAPSAVAQVALKNGLAAAQLKHWDVAIRHFADAHKAAPTWPEAIFDLGLAEAQVSGRELRAIGWLEAYLALVPTAENAAAVRAQILDLDKRAEAKARALIDLLNALNSSQPKDYASGGLTSIITLRVSIGDLAAGQSYVDKSNENDKDSNSGTVIRALIAAGLIADALKTIEQIPATNTVYRDSVHKPLVLAHLAAGRLAEADAVLKLINAKSGDYYLTPAHALIVALHKAGQKERAAALLAEVKTHIEKISGTYRNGPLAELAATEGQIGDLVTADARLRQLKALAPTLPRYTDQMFLYDELAKASHKLGRQREAAAFMQDAYAAGEKCKSVKELCPLGIVFFVYLNTEDWSGARAWIGKIRPGQGAAQFREERETDLAAAIRWTTAEKAAQKIRFSASGPERTQAWSEYVNTVLNTTLFTDHAKAVKELANYKPKGTEYRSHMIFQHVNRAASDYVDKLALFRQLRSQ